MSLHDRIERALEHLCIPKDRLRLVALLPLVEVAWSDGSIADEERRMILAVADKHGLLTDEDRPIVEDWLSEKPSGLFLHHTRLLIGELGNRLPEDLDATEVVAWCWALAAAAGGLFGSRMMSVSADEKAALERVAEALGVTEIKPEWRTRTI
ncbi:MAG: TerB family tellurite resistance protein [Alphaproteobacteria bacterium]|nr:TerB family tellurite resistance protein [Alphaproteobacteria bacterium]MCB9697238.1 TerB family tellurite resistance protein [Alphaproteobacteria bacterium]